MSLYCAHCSASLDNALGKRQVSVTRRISVQVCSEACERAYAQTVREERDRDTLGAELSALLRMLGGQLVDVPGDSQ